MPVEDHSLSFPKTQKLNWFIRVVIAGDDVQLYPLLAAEFGKAGAQRESLLAKFTATGFCQVARHDEMPAAAQIFAPSVHAGEAAPLMPQVQVGNHAHELAPFGVQLGDWT